MNTAKNNYLATYIVVMPMHLSHESTNSGILKMKTCIMLLHIRILMRLPNLSEIMPTIGIIRTMNGFVSS